MAFRLTIIPETGTSMATPHDSIYNAVQDGELIARLLLQEEDLELSDEMTAQLVAARLGVPIANADRFKSLYTISELQGLRSIGQRYVEYVVTDPNAHAVKRKRIDSAALRVAMRIGRPDPIRERPN